MPFSLPSCFLHSALFPGAPFATLGEATHVCSPTQPCLALCGPVDWSPPGSSVHRAFQERIPEWVALWMRLQWAPFTCCIAFESIYTQQDLFIQSPVGRHWRFFLVWTIKHGLLCTVLNSPFSGYMNTLLLGIPLGGSARSWGFTLYYDSHIISLISNLYKTS